MKLSGLLAAMGFLMCGASVLLTIMTLVSYESGNGLTLLISALVFLNGLIAIGVAIISFLTILVFLVSYELYKPAYTYEEAQQRVGAEYSLAIRDSHFKTIRILDTNYEHYRVAAGEEGQIQEFMINPKTGEIKALKTDD